MTDLRRPPLLQRLQADPASEARIAGRNTAVFGRVVLDEVTATQVKAEVDFRRPRRVTLTWTGLELLYSCTCPDYTGTLCCCQHVWAVLHRVDDLEGALRAISPHRITLSPRDRQPYGRGLEPGGPGVAACKSTRQLVYAIDRRETLAQGSLVLSLCAREAGRPDSRGQFTTEQIEETPWVVGRNERDGVLSVLLEEGRLFCRERRNAELRPLVGDSGPAWEFRINVRESGDRTAWEVGGLLVRGEETLAPRDPWLVLSGGWLLAGGKVARLRDQGTFPWLSALRREGTVRVPRGRESELLERLWKLPGSHSIEWPEALKLREERFEPSPLLRVSQGDCGIPDRLLLRAALWFLYDDELVEYANPARAVPEIPRRRLLIRDASREAEHRAFLGEYGISPPPLGLVQSGRSSPLEFSLSPDALPGAVRGLTAKGWQVEAEGKIYRSRRRFKLQVTSGIDWFDLEVEAVYGETAVPFPRLLKAIERGKEYVVLDDGSRGILPETWIGEYRLLLALGRLHEGRLRFQRSQIAVLDRLLAGEAGVTWDPDFGAARAAFGKLGQIRPVEPEGDFRGELRPYQKEGLGWLRFLEQAGLGGCLADDMGLGKTIQVLAFLEGRRSRGAGAPSPSLAVVPRSLVFNWTAEARRFTPALRVLEHHGPRRMKEEARLRQFDLVVTTYGTLVRDAAFLAKCSFDCLILDEAQAIKNPGSTFARAARLLRASHRLALSGTPIENHLGELWSLFEFLDPGLLGSASRFRESVAEGEAAPPFLSRLLRPLILRRTKRQVESALPERIEQTVFCDLEARHRREYDEIRDHYRSTLLEGLEDPRNRFRVLEGLLRLRQAACHPGLLDRKRSDEPSAKLKVLLDQLSEIGEAGNKALVFSQFTTLLEIVRKRLEARGVSHQYLDGAVRDRAARVERFQTDPDCRVFLVSLKAGGVGLNLTAAGYVFLLDPWWNPASEAQAIDRAHRIGQQRTVFAYRLIARGTVEERILELQARKRKLAEEILAGAGSGLRDLKPEDVELLFS